MSERDEAYLLDVLIGGRKVLRYLAGVSWERFQEDELLQDAVLRNLQIVGEAARMISDQWKADHPEIPWRRISGMRNRLVHEYFRVDVEKVWDTVRDDLPALLSQIEPLVPPDEGG